MIHRLALLAACFAASLPAATFSYSDFSSAANISLVGDAELLSNAIRLTPATENQVGAVWYSTPVNVAGGFTTSFQFQVTDRGGHEPDWEEGVSNNGADGFAFVIQGLSSEAIGLYASGIGYYGLADSLAVEFDMWANKPSYCEPDGNHIAINSLGTAGNRPEHCAGDGSEGVFNNPTLGITPVGPDMSNGSIYSAQIVYTPGLMQIYFENSLVLAASVDLGSLLQLNGGNAYIGFTSSTGGAWENHDIVQWNYSDVPEPATWTMLGAGLAALGLYRRRG